MKRFSIGAFLIMSFVGQGAFSAEFSKNPERSFYIGFDMGAGLELGSEARFPADTYYSIANPGKSNPEAYSLGAFLFGLYGGFRFNENIALEGGWHEQQHETDPIWGGSANYEIGHLALRLAIPFETRQTLVFRLGPTIGGFSYGESSSGMFDDNRRLVAGGLVGVTLEHEIAVGIVASLNLTYLPMFRRGEGEVLQLCMHVDSDYAAERDFRSCGIEEPYQYYPPGAGDPWEWVLAAEKDFSNNQFVQSIWISLGLQFEWIFR